MSDERERALREYDKAKAAASMKYNCEAERGRVLPDQREFQARIWHDYQDACSAARERLAAAYADDPVASFIITQVMPDLPDPARVALGAWPFTRDELDKLAFREGWCGGYGEWLEEAGEAGILQLIPRRAEAEIVRHA